MSNEERAYMLANGCPLTDDERGVAIAMHQERAVGLACNIAKLEAELRVMRDSHAGETSAIQRLNEDWKDLGPDTTLFISESERRRILAGLPLYEIEIRYSLPSTIQARFVPDETERYANNPTSGR